MQKIRRRNLVEGLKEYQTSCAKVGHKGQGMSPKGRPEQQVRARITIR